MRTGGLLHILLFICIKVVLKYVEINFSGIEKIKMLY